MAEAHDIDAQEARERRIDVDDTRIRMRGQGVRCRSRTHRHSGSGEDRAVEDGIGRAVIDLDDPEIGVAAALPRDVGVGIGFRHRCGAGDG